MKTKNLIIHLLLITVLIVHTCSSPAFCDNTESSSLQSSSAQAVPEPEEQGSSLQSSSAQAVPESEDPDSSTSMKSSAAAATARDDFCTSLPQRLTSPDLRFSISLPDGWENMSGTLTLSGADKAFMIRCGKREIAAYLLFGCESKSEKVPDIGIYSDILTEGITDSEILEGAEVTESNSMTLRGSGFQGTVSVITALYEDLHVTIRLYTFEGVHEFYQFFCWSSEENEEEAGADFAQIVQSFRIEK